MLVFLSHSSKDQRFVEQKLIPFLQSHGVKAWYSTVNIRAADNWERSIREALLSCDFFLVVLSPNSVNSEWVRAEVHWAMENRKGRVVPVLVADCDPSQLHLKLAPIEYVDLHDASQAAWDKLAAFWNKPTNGQQTQQATGTESGCQGGDRGKDSRSASVVEFGFDAPINSQVIDSWDCLASSGKVNPEVAWVVHLAEAVAFFTFASETRTDGMPKPDYQELLLTVAVPCRRLGFTVGLPASLPKEEADRLRSEIESILVLKEMRLCHLFEFVLDVTLIHELRVGLGGLSPQETRVIEQRVLRQAAAAGLWNEEMKSIIGGLCTSAGDADEDFLTTFSMFVMTVYRRERD